MCQDGDEDNKEDEKQENRVNGNNGGNFKVDFYAIYNIVKDFPSNRKYIRKGQKLPKLDLTFVLERNKVVIFVYIF